MSKSVDPKKGYQEKLDTWKEIAHYLNREIRTCQRWERELGLPVNRLDDSPRSRVFAYKNEIDNWVKEKLNNNTKRKQTSSFKQKFFLTVPFILMMAAGVYFGIKIIIAKKYSSSSPLTNVQPGNIRHQQPTIMQTSQASDFKISDSKLLILDENQKILGEYDTGCANLEDDKHYKNQFQNKSFNGLLPLPPLVIIKDIDNDGSKEILFAISNWENKDEDLLVCLSSEGKEIWKFDSGGEAVFGNNLISDDYVILGFDIADFNNDGKFELMLLCNHRTNFPSRIVFLDSMGNQLGSYWNTGHIKDYVFVDLDNDGSKEIMLTCINEEYGCLCVLVLEYPYLAGFSPQIKKYYKYFGDREHFEKYYIRLPKKSLDKFLSEEKIYTTIKVFEDKPDSRFVFDGYISYIFDYKLALSEVYFSIIFSLEYDRFIREGKVNKTMPQLKQELIEEGALYFTGNDWSKTPTMTSYWLNIQ